jgi:cysteine synthase A
VSRFLKGLNRDVRAVAVEPEESPVLSRGVAGGHGIQGIGAGFVPRNLDRAIIDDVETVSTVEAMEWARRLAREEGLLVGVSTGANVAVAHRLAVHPENAGKTIVTFACSTGERYLSTPLYQLIGIPGGAAVADFGL